MKLAVMAVGKPKLPFILEGLDHYSVRLQKMLPVEWIFIPDPSRGKSLSEERRKSLESSEILKRLGPLDRLFLMDEQGLFLDSEELCERVYSEMASGRGRLVFLIGGPYGVARSVYDRSNVVVSLSRFTFTHEMALLLLVEQLYRSAMIHCGSKYHHR